MVENHLSDRPVILTDVDGILVKWASGLPFFAADHNFSTEMMVQMIVDEKFRSMSEIFGCSEEFSMDLMTEYNNSRFIRYLAGYDDALSVVNELKKKYDFVAITALGNTSKAALNRMANLNILFPGAFKELMVVNYNESKTQRYLEAKRKYGDRIVCFIDDLANNLEDCHNVMSHVPLIHMVRGPRDEPKCEVMTVKDWNCVSDWLKAQRKLKFNKEFGERVSGNNIYDLEPVVVNRMFTLESCIEQYGEKTGTEVFNSVTKCHVGRKPEKPEDRPVKPMYP